MLPVCRSLRVLHTRGRQSLAHRVGSTATFSVASASSAAHVEFLDKVARVERPVHFDTLVSLLELQGKEFKDPWLRKDCNPFLIPLCQYSSAEPDSTLCYLRWPTQKSDMELQLVKSTAMGISLISLNTEMYCKRIAAEMDFGKVPEIETALKVLAKNGLEYTVGSYEPFKKLKISAQTAKGSDAERLILDRYLISKVGPFPDCFERIADNFLGMDNVVSALVTAERATSWFYSYGHIINFQTKLLVKAGRDMEAVESARASMSAPKWTLAHTQQEMEDAVRLAGYTSTLAVGEMHKQRSEDPRTKNIEEDGLDPIQVILDQAAHLMDAVALGAVEGGWEGAKEGIARRYQESGYPDMAEFILADRG